MIVPSAPAPPGAPVSLVIFDFDGTLGDTFPFLLSVFNELARRYRFKPVATHEIAALRHLTARELLRHVGLSAWKFPFVTRAFLSMMKSRQEGIRLFDGVAAMLAQLAHNGAVLAIVSSNSRDNIVATLGPHNAALISHFECRASVFGKASRLKRVLRSTGIAADDAIYIGDQSTDYDAASAAGMAFGAVAWGYADIAALRRYTPAHEFASVAELATLTITAPISP